MTCKTISYELCLTERCHNYNKMHNFFVIERDIIALILPSNFERLQPSPHLRQSLDVESCTLGKVFSCARKFVKGHSTGVVISAPRAKEAGLSQDVIQCWDGTSCRLDGEIGSFSLLYWAFFSTCLGRKRFQYYQTTLADTSRRCPK